MFIRAPSPLSPTLRSLLGTDRGLRGDWLKRGGHCAGASPTPWACRALHSEAMGAPQPPSAPAHVSPGTRACQALGLLRSSHRAPRCLPLAEGDKGGILGRCRADCSRPAPSRPMQGRLVPPRPCAQGTLKPRGPGASSVGKPDTTAPPRLGAPCLSRLSTLTWGRRKGKLGVAAQPRVGT